MARTTQLKKRLFLEAYAEMGNITHACKASAVPRRTFYHWTEHDEAFAAQVREAEIEAVESLEREARRRAIRGSDTLLIFLLKAARPDKYRDNVSIKHSGEVVHVTMSAGEPIDAYSD